MNNFKIVFISISLAIVFNVGYGQFPIGQYFEPTGYTYMIWVKILAYSYYQGLISFMNNKVSRLDAIEMYTEILTGKLKVSAYEGYNQKFLLSSSDALPIGEWVHITVTSGSQNIEVYINSNKIGSFTSSRSTGQTQYNYIGLGPYAGYTESQATFDEFKIFNRKLNLQEIFIEMNKIQPFDIILN